MNTYKATFLTLTVWWCLFPAAAGAQYKDFVRSESKQTLFELAFDKKNISITIYDDKKALTSQTERVNIAVSENQVKILDDVLFTTEGLSFQGQLLSYERIVDSRITANNNETNITFYTYAQAESSLAKKRHGNIISFSQPTTVAAKDFIRGLIFSITGSIEINGEVNKDIISLFGDVYLFSTATARGDIASISGLIKVEDHASIYGEIYSGEKEYDSRKYKFYRERELEPGIMLNYNRVDGLLLGGSLGFVDSDSIYPLAKIGVGYAFESERLRYFLRLEQLLWHRKSLAVGATFYRRLSSEDDWLLGNGENSVFALIATEDFKEYYESEGVAAWARIYPIENLQVQVGYSYDDTRWFDARRKMWSLFGGNKLFMENFSTVNGPLRAVGISEIDSSSNGAFHFQASFDNGNLDNGFGNSGWRIRGEMEWSHPDFSSDFNYRRYTLSLVRYQAINKYTDFRFRGHLGNSDGYLPMYKRYFVGGLGTLRGYQHKEFIGTRFWLTNAEYRVSLPTSYVAYLILFWDISQIANDAKLDDRAEIRQNIGLGVDLGGLRINVAKRLDGAQERDPKVYVRLARMF